MTGINLTLPLLLPQHELPVKLTLDVGYKESLNTRHALFYGSQALLGRSRSYTTIIGAHLIYIQVHVPEGASGLQLAADLLVHHRVSCKTPRTLSVHSS